MLYEDFYLLLKQEYFNKGSKDLVRFQCACHKMNISIRLAIKNHIPLTELLQMIGKTNATIRKTIRFSHTFRLLNCRLRLENMTRWSSAYLMLESVKRAYNK